MHRKKKSEIFDQKSSEKQKEKDRKKKLKVKIKKHSIEKQEKVKMSYEKVYQKG